MLLKDLIQKLTEISNLNSKWLDKEVYVQGTISYPELIWLLKLILLLMII